MASGVFNPSKNFTRPGSKNPIPPGKQPARQGRQPATTPNPFIRPGAKQPGSMLQSGQATARKNAILKQQKGYQN